MIVMIVALVLGPGDADGEGHEGRVTGEDRDEGGLAEGA
jgi:hypothetical protein